MTSATTSVAVATLRHQGRRYIAPGLAILLGVAFLAATLGLTSGLQTALTRGMAGDLATYDAVVTADTTSIPPATVKRLDTVRQVDTYTAGQTTGMQIGNRGDFVLVTSRPRSTSQARLTSGQWPGRGEIAVSERVASSQDLGIGSVLRPQGTADPTPLTVVGLVDAGADPRFGPGTPVVFAAEDTITAIAGETSYAEVVVTGHDGTSPEQVRDAVRRALGPGVTVRTGADEAKVLLDQAGGAGTMLAAFLLGFGAVALLVAAIVIANTFTILLARRARETALLRCVGATRGQVVRGALLEAVGLGVTASAAGAALGVLVGAAAGPLLGGLGYGEGLLATPWWAVALPMLTGVAVTVAAALWPVWRAGRVTPLAALTPQEGTRPHRVVLALRLGAGAFMLLAGGGLLVLGALTHSVVAGIPGGMLSFLGVVLLLPVLVPGVMRLLGAVAARTGAPAELAVGNIHRHPTRAAATAGALLVGVTLVVMTVVGGATGSQSISKAVDDEYAIDLAVSTTGAGTRGLPADAEGRLRAIPRIVDAASLPGARISVAGEEQDVVAIPAGADRVARRPEAVRLVQPGTVVVRETQRSRGLVDGREVVLKGPDGERRLTVAVDSRLGFAAAVSVADLGALDADAPVRTVLLRADSSDDPQPVLEAVDRVVRPWGDATVGGSLGERAMLDDAMATAILVLTALLGISVLIALVGVGNTLSLSVIERSRESALVRALGMTRGQLQAMLAVEGALLALGGTVLGLLLGTAYGIAGTAALISEVDLVVAVPWGQLGLIALVALAAGVVASALPGRRAGRAAPSVALAAE